MLEETESRKTAEGIRFEKFLVIVGLLLMIASIILVFIGLNIE